MLKTSLPTLLSLLLLFSCSSSTQDSERTFPVEIATSTRQDVPLLIQTIGTITSENEVFIRPQVSGIFKKSYVQEGQHVKAGDLLFQIDNRAYKAAYDQAQAELDRNLALLEFAKAKLKRNEELVQADYLSKLTFEQYQSDLKAQDAAVQKARAEAADAKLNLDWTTLSAPFDGKVSLFDIDPGNLLQAYSQNPIASLIQMDPILVRFALTQKEFLQLQTAKKQGLFHLFVNFADKPSIKREGTLRFIDNKVDAETGTIAMKGEIINNDELFFPGEYVIVQLMLGTELGAVVIPQEAVQIGDKGPYVFVLDQKTARVSIAEVTLGPRFDNSVVVAKGLEADVAVITKGQLNLRSNAKVEVK